MEDEAGDRAGEPERPPRARRPAGRVLVVALALIALGALVTAVALWSSRSDLRREADQRDEVASVAGRFAEVLLSYDHQDLDASVDAVRELATADFADEYSGAFDAGLGGQIETLEATSTARIREVFVASFTGDTTRAVVIADSDIVSAAGSRATVGTYLDITLIRLDGRWQVDDVTSVANAGSRLSPVPGSGADDPVGGDQDGGGTDSSSSTSSSSSSTSTTSAP